MYRLTDDMARRRCLYRRPLATLPDLLLIDIPPRYLGPDLLLGHYYPIIAETQEELDEVERWLDTPRPTPVGPNLLSRRPSSLRGDRIVFAQFAPPMPGWPHALLCYWPAIYAAMSPDPMLFDRGAYSTELFREEADLQIHSRRLVAALGAPGTVDVSIIRPQPEPSGQA